jgi:hypothetical protein
LDRALLGRIGQALACWFVISRDQVTGAEADQRGDRVSRTKRLTVGLILPVALLAGCGGGSDAVSAREYLSGVCGAVGDWAGVIQEKGGELQNLATESSPEEVKTAIVNFMDEIVAETEDLITGVEDAGVPDVDNGAEIADSVTSGLQKVQTVFEDARDEIEGVSTADQEEFAQGVQGAFTSLSESSTEVGQSLDELNTDELDRVAEDVDACQEIPEF